MKVTKLIVRAGVIAALYAVLTLAFAFSSFSTAIVQFRVSEALTLLPLFFPEAIVGLWVGCLIGNIYTGNALDIFFGSGATLIAALLTFSIGRAVRRPLPRILLGALPPVFVNALLVPMTYTIFIGETAVYWIHALFVLAGQAAVLAVIGVPFAYALGRRFYKPKETLWKGRTTPK